MADSKKVPRGTILDTDADLISVGDAAVLCGLEPKRLLGRMFRNRIGDPIGDGRLVYRWSLPARAADQPAGVTP